MLYARRAQLHFTEVNLATAPNSIAMATAKHVAETDYLVRPRRAASPLVSTFGGPDH